VDGGGKKICLKVAAQKKALDCSGFPVPGERRGVEDKTEGKGFYTPSPTDGGTRRLWKKMTQEEIAGKKDPNHASGYTTGDNQLVRNETSLEEAVAQSQYANRHWAKKNRQGPKLFKKKR